MPRWTVERSLMPLLDVTMVLVGLFLVLMAVQFLKGKEDASVLAGKSIVLIEVVFENDTFQAYAVDQDSGNRTGNGYPLNECQHIVEAVLASREREDEARPTVLVQMPPLNEGVVAAWTASQQQDMARALDGSRWVQVWAE